MYFRLSSLPASRSFWEGVFNGLYDDLTSSNEMLVGKDTEKGRLWVIEMPGVSKENLSVESDGKVVLVEGKRGSKSYSYRLPLSGYSPAVVYKLRDGVLEILAPKEKASAKTIKGKEVEEI